MINHVTTENGKNTTVVLAAGTTDNGKVKTSAKHDQTDLKSSRSVSEKEEKKLADENLAVMANEEKLDSQMTEEISEKSLPKREKSDMSIEAKVETDEIGVGSEPKPEPAESECQTDPKVEELFEEMEDQQPSSEVPHLDLISPRTDAETQIDIEEVIYLARVGLIG